MREYALRWVWSEAKVGDDLSVRRDGHCQSSRAACVHSIGMIEIVLKKLYESTVNPKVLVNL